MSAILLVSWVLNLTSAPSSLHFTCSGVCFHRHAAQVSSSSMLALCRHPLIPSLLRAGCMRVCGCPVRGTAGHGLLCCNRSLARAVTGITARFLPPLLLQPLHAQRHRRVLCTQVRQDARENLLAKRARRRCRQRSGTRRPCAPGARAVGGARGGASRRAGGQAPGCCVTCHTRMNRHYSPAMVYGCWAAVTAVAGTMRLDVPPDRLCPECACAPACAQVAHSRSTAH